jgi:O-antigen/teichoic acid export membrane protein
MSVQRIKSLTKDSLIYGLSGIINRMITIFLVPIYTRIFLPSDYGIISLINTTFFLAGILAICALDNAAARWFYDSEEVTARKKIFSSWFWFQLGVSVVLALILFLATPIFSKYVFHLPFSKLWLIWLLPCCTLITNILPNMIWNWYRLQRKPKATVIFNLSQSITTILLTILFVIVLKWHIAGVYAALFISGFLFSCIALVQLWSWLPIKYFDRLLIRQMLRFALPMVPAAIAYWLINSTAAYFILFLEGHEKGTADVGLFTVGATVASAVSLFTGAFQQAWGPFAFSIINEPDAKRTYANVFLVFGIISSIIILGMFLFTPEVLMLFTNANYYGSAWVASILSTSIILIAFSYIASIGASIMKNSTYYSKAVLFGGLVTVAGNIFLIPALGKEGAALATVLGQIIVLIYLFYKSNKLYHIPYDFSKVIFFLILGASLGLVVRVINFPSPVLALTTKVSVLIMFSVVILFSIKEVNRMILMRFRLNKI